jgi:RNA polymerase sigma-70 factor (ECF subfamily)
MPADITTLLAEAPWLERLARSLTGDPVEADDLVQDTYAAALRSPPETDRPIRPWLRRVAINLVRMRHRVRTRRAATESVVEAQTDPVRDAEQLLERARLERRLAELVLELDEPFRTTVLLRYREGLRAEQIARQHGIPASTVRTRLKTGLDRLRRELADDERKQLHALFAAPLAVGARPVAQRTIGRIVMAKLTSKVAIIIALTLLLVVGAWLMWPRLSPTSRNTHDGATASVAHETTRALIARPAMFAQAGIGARRLHGRVTSDSAPFRGAVVQLVHAETEVVLAEARSSGDGTFDFGERPADRYIVTASAPARTAVPVRVDLRMPSAGDVELRLAGCSHVRGAVVDGSGAPIDHARIAHVEAPGVFAETDATGRYDLCTHYGSAMIRYSASGYHSVEIGLDVAANTKHDVVLVPEAIVEGKVIDESGTPVAGAWVVIDPNQLRVGQRDAPAVGFSNTDGTFRITAVSPGRNLVAAFAPGLRSLHKQELVTGAGQVASGVTVRVVRTATISGVVLAGDKPVVGAGVGMKIGNRDETGILAVTQADGSFVIDRAPRGDVGLYVENHTIITPRSVHVDERSPRVKIEVQQMGSVRGRVLRGTDPVADAQVACPRRWPKVFTDASGSYACDGVDDGHQDVQADLPSGEWGRATVTVTRGETANADILITFSGAICGRVVDQNGQGVSGLEVRVAERTTGDNGNDTTGDDGAFCTRLLTGGTYGVAVFAGPRALEPVAPLAPIVLGPKETKTISIAVNAPTLKISGTVSDPHGRPVVDALVHLVVADNHPGPMVDPGSGSLAVTDDAGHFTLSKLAAGDYMIIASARDGSEVTTPPIAAGSHDVVITLAAAGRIEGQIAGFTSAPTITGSKVSGRLFRIVDLEVDGPSFHASGLSPGTYVLMALTDAREADTKEIVVRAGEVTNVTLTNRGTTAVNGVVRDFRTHAPVPGQRCTSFARDGDAMGNIYAAPDEGAPTDESGAFQLTGPAGEIEVGCFSPGYQSARVLVAPRGQTISLDVFAVALTQERGTIDAELAFASNRITDITSGGAADRAGLAVGDEIITVDGLSVVDLAAGTAMLVITQRPAGSTAALTIRRGGEQRIVTVTVRDGS